LDTVAGGTTWAVAWLVAAGAAGAAGAAVLTTARGLAGAVLARDVPVVTVTG
jgi:hypothetical protein